MASIHSRDDLIAALDACWKLLCEKTQSPDRRNYGADAPELVKLTEEHPCLAELDESGAAGYCGIGLGCMGGHVVG
jgi:hypothetical protein